MQSAVNSILRQCKRKSGDKLNILTHTAHEAFQTLQAKTGHNFFSLKFEHSKNWDTKFRPVPANYYTFPENTLPDNISFDIALAHHRFAAFQTIKPLADRLHIPLIVVEHTEPTNQSLLSNLDKFKQMRGDVNVFISEYSREKWGWGEDEAEVIHHGIDTDVFYPQEVRENVVLSVVNDFRGRGEIVGFPTWERVIRGLPYKLVGDSAGLSRAAKDVDELSHFYRSSRIFFSSAKMSPLPMSTLEAMSSGCAVVSTYNSMISKVIEHGVNGFITNDEDEMRKYLMMLLNDWGLAKKLGDAAAKTIREKFPLSSFVNKWNEVFDRAANIVYKG